MRNGITKILAALAIGLFGDKSNPDNGKLAAGHMQHRNRLLVNDYSCPAPSRVLNQRQKRKRIRQQPHGKKL